MLVIHFYFILFYLFIYLFFWLQCVKQECTLFASSKNQTVCTLFLQTITFNSNWSINSPRETAVDIVLDASENSHGNVYSEVLSKIEAYQHGVCWTFQIKIYPRFSKHRRDGLQE